MIILTIYEFRRFHFKMTEKVQGWVRGTGTVTHRMAKKKDSATESRGTESGLRGLEPVQAVEQIGSRCLSPRPALIFFSWFVVIRIMLMVRCFIIINKYFSVF